MDIDDEKFYISKSVKFDEIQNKKTLECDVQMPLSSKLSSMDHENDVDTENEKIDDYIEEADINHGTTTSQFRRSSRVRKLVQRLTYDS